MRRALLLTAFLVPVGAFSAAADAAAQVSGPRSEAAAFVKRCQAAADKVGVGTVWKAHVARVRARVATADAACDSKGRMAALAKAAPADRGLADVVAGEAGIADGLANFRKYLADIAAGKVGHSRILKFARGEVEQGGVLFQQALFELQ